MDKYADIEGLRAFINAKTTAASGFGYLNNNTKATWSEIASFSFVCITRTHGHQFNQKRSYHWGSAAYARGCIEPGYLRSTEKLKRVSVKTAFEFDANHFMGSNIDELVAVVARSNNVSLKEYLSKAPFPYDNYKSLSLIVTQAPSAKGPFALDITVELDNGEVYTTRTPVIELI